MIFPKRWVKAEISSKKFEIWWCKANEMEFGFHKLNTWSSVQRVLCWVKFIKFQAVVLDVFQVLQVQKSLETGRDRSTPWGLTPMISHESPPSFLAHWRWKDNLRRTAIYVYIHIQGQIVRLFHHHHQDHFDSLLDHVSGLNLCLSLQYLWI